MPSLGAPIPADERLIRPIADTVSAVVQTDPVIAAAG